jgi:hypothetical protein
MPDLKAVHRLGMELHMPDRRAPRADRPAQNPYHKEHFASDPASDTYRSPLGQTLRYYKALRLIAYSSASRK